MANIIDYIDWRGDITFDKSPFNDIDSLILTQLSMIDLEGIVPKTISQGYISLRNASDLYFGEYRDSRSKIGLVFPEKTFELFKKAAESERFCNVKLSCFANYINTETEEQFAAVTARISDSMTAIVFRGTDDTIVGWKEDFNMSFMSPVPSQLEAVKYIEGVADRIKGKIYVAGHSKGGNLSLYASTKCSPKIQKRIVNAYNFDGPGFSKEFLELDEYKALEGRIKSVVPQSSIVGMLLENDNKYSVVKSIENGIMQHNAFSWEVIGNKFVLLDQLTRESRDMSKLLRVWMDGMSIEEREKFVDAVYDILTATDSKTLSELSENKYSILRSLKNTDKKTRNMVLKTLGAIFTEGGKQLVANITNSIFKPKNTDNESDAEQKKESKDLFRLKKRTDK